MVRGAAGKRPRGYTSRSSARRWLRFLARVFLFGYGGEGAGHDVCCRRSCAVCCGAHPEPRHAREIEMTGRAHLAWGIEKSKEGEEMGCCGVGKHLGRPAWGTSGPS
jgi:hypothetical protein